MTQRLLVACSPPPFVSFGLVSSPLDHSFPMQRNPQIQSSYDSKPSCLPTFNDIADFKNWATPAGATPAPNNGAGSAVRLGALATLLMAALMAALL